MSACLEVRIKQVHGVWQLSLEGEVKWGPQVLLPQADLLSDTH